MLDKPIESVVDDSEPDRNPEIQNPTHQDIEPGGSGALETQVILQMEVYEVCKSSIILAGFQLSV